MSEKQDWNLRCSQLKLDRKTCQGTAEQPQLPAVAGETFHPRPVLSTVDPCTAPHKFPNTQCAEHFPCQALPRTWFAKFCAWRESRPQSSWNARLFLSKMVPAHKCFKILLKSFKNQFALRQNNANLLKCLTVDVFGNKSVDVSSFLCSL